jgi:hypothetical protein
MHNNRQEQKTFTFVVDLIVHAFVVLISVRIQFACIINVTQEFQVL